jgi:hypothetical protein
MLYCLIFVFFFGYSHGIADGNAMHDSLFLNLVSDIKNSNVFNFRVTLNLFFKYYRVQMVISLCAKKHSAVELNLSPPLVVSVEEFKSLFLPVFFVCVGEKFF